MKTETATTFSAIAASEERYQLATYKKMPVAAVRGLGAWIYDVEGNRYLDLYGGHAVAATGHCHPRVVAAIQRQAEQLLFYSNLVYSETRARAAERLASLAPSSLNKVFFCNSGTEANENAMRIARLTTGRERVITFSGGFHGRTADSISATFLGKYRELGRPNVPGHLKAEFGDIESVERIADETVAAIMLEPIQSMAGVRTSEPKFFQELRNLADARGIALIFDEVQTGMGRTGEWFFSGSEASGGVLPDIVTLAKALGSGVPVGACIVNDQFASKIKENDLGTTFGGGMLAMAAVTATLEAIEEDRMLENVLAMESYLRKKLADIPQDVRVRGRGLLLGIEFREKASAIHQALLERHVIVGTSSDPHVLRLLPPLCLRAEEVDLFVEKLEQSLGTLS